MTSQGGSHYGAPDGNPSAPDAWGSPTPAQQQAPFGAYPAQPPAAPYGQPYQPQPYNQPYGQQPYGYPYAPPRRTNGLAIASMVLGILWIFWIGSILALIFGYVASKQIRERGDDGKGMATAGIVLGWVGVGILVLRIVAGVVAATF